MEIEEIWQNRHQELIRAVNSASPQDGLNESGIPSVKFYRASKLSNIEHSVYEPAVIFVLQGVKSVALGERKYTYGEASYLLTSVHLPIAGQIIEASEESPFLSVVVCFSPCRIFEIIKEPNSDSNPKSDIKSGLAVGRVDLKLFDALCRLLSLLGDEAAILALSSDIIKEILFWILRGEHALMLRQVALSGSSANKIAKTILEINEDPSERICIKELAKNSDMSVSSFHKNFKEMTSMSPVQYQKRLRLQEAKKLMLSSGLEVGDAAFAVGYESPSQFSREYSRLFGAPPSSDIRRIKYNN